MGTRVWVHSMGIKRFPYEEGKPINKLSSHETMTELNGVGSCRKGSMTRDLNTMHQHQQTSTHAWTDDINITSRTLNYQINLPRSKANLPFTYLSAHLPLILNVMSFSPHTPPYSTTSNIPRRLQQHQQREALKRKSPHTHTHHSSPLLA